MGLSSKQVSGDEFDWAKNLMQNGALELPNVTPIRQQQQPVPTLKCPRCESTNTKFCYYNNYNRSQPRHFCKSCRRHWTKGGTLRNVPVGGGRKNKRLKTSSSTTSTTNNKNDKTSHGSKITKDLIQPGQQVQQQLSLGLGDERKFSEILYQSLLQSTTSPLVPSLQSNYINSNLLNSSLSLDPLLPLPNLPSTSLSAFNNPTSMSSPFNAGFQSPNVLNYSGEAKCSEDFSTSATITPMPVQLQIPSTNSEVDSSSYWNWDDLNILI